MASAEITVNVRINVATMYTLTWIGLPNSRGQLRYEWRDVYNDGYRVIETGWWNYRQSEPPHPNRTVLN